MTYQWRAGDFGTMAGDPLSPIPFKPANDANTSLLADVTAGIRNCGT
jgi:hypothetical protein